MSDAQEAAAREMYEQHENMDWDAVDLDGYEDDEGKSNYRFLAGHAIAAAEPHFRRKHRQELLDELIEEATKGRKEAESMRDSDSHLRWFFAQDWIMTKKEREAE